MPEDIKLGRATTEDLMRELINRFGLCYYLEGSYDLRMINRGFQLSELLGGLSQEEKDFRVTTSRKKK